MGGLELHEVEQALHELARKELVRPAHTSSMQGEAEHGFWHLLVRDVCYQQIPRAARAARHRAAATWLEKQAGERVEDLADVVAHHYLSALELTRSARRPELAAELQTGAIRFLALAGERALGLDVERAEQSLAKAVALCPAGHPERGLLLARWAQAAQQQNRLEEARKALVEALVLYRERGEAVATGRVLIELANVLRRLGDSHAEGPLVEALALLEAQPSGPELVQAYAGLAGVRNVQAAYSEAIVAAEQALALAAELGLPQPAAALGSRGTARCALGEQQGVEDMRLALGLLVEQGQGRAAAVLYNNLALIAWLYEGSQAAVSALQEGIDFCQRRGLTEWALSMSGGVPPLLAELGQTEQALVEAGPLADRLQAAGNVSFIEPRSLQLFLLAERGTHNQASAPDGLVAAARDSDEPQRIAQAFTASARLLLAQGQTQRARSLLVELSEVDGTRADPIYTSLLPVLVRTALALDDLALARGLTDDVEPAIPLADNALASCRGLLAEAEGHQAEAADLHADAAKRWQEFANVPERAYALLGQGRCLLTLANPAAEDTLRPAAELFSSMGYRPAHAETDALLEQATALAS